MSKPGQLRYSEASQFSSVTELVGLVTAHRIEELSKVLRPISDEQEANAAVALLLMPRDVDVSVLLVERVRNPADTWSGQVAFPGGKRETTDANLTRTVVRETLEETSINLVASGRILGVLTALRSRPRPDLKILPFVVLLESEQRIKLSLKELKGFAWVPLEKLVESRGTANVSIGEVPAFILGEMVVWGLTYKILSDFFELLERV